jgi:hypothetical protein
VRPGAPTDPALGLALLGISAGAVVTMVLTGRLCQRFGSAPVTVAAGALLAFSLSLPPHAGSAWALGGVVLVFGTTFGAIKRRPVMPSFHAAFSLGDGQRRTRRAGGRPTHPPRATPSGCQWGRLRRPTRRWPRVRPSPPVAAALAVDGTDELLAGFHTRSRSQVRSERRRALRIRAVDAPGAGWRLELSPEPPRVSRTVPSRPAECEISGRAPELYPALPNRRLPGGRRDVSGDEGPAELW